MKKSFLWDGERLTEIQPEESAEYADKIAAEREIDRRRREAEERDKHPGTYA